VKGEDVLTMLDAARWAPSGGNHQPWHFIVIKERSRLEEMARLIEERVEALPERFAELMPDGGSLVDSFVRHLRRSSLFFAGAPLTVAVLVRTNPHTRPHVQYMTARGATLYEAHRDLGYVNVQSCAAAVQNLLLAAHSLGYGACWMNVPYMAKEDLKELLNVQPPWDLLALVPVGKPASGLEPAKGSRRGIEELVSFA
jgi:nitroreductase